MSSWSPLRPSRSARDARGLGRPAAVVVEVGLIFLLAGCDAPSPTPPPASPQVVLLEGGGYTGGPIDGALAVAVIDDVTHEPLEGAAVRVGRSTAALACTEATDAAGAALFSPANCLFLRGPQTVTVSAPGYVAATWLGVSGASVTIPLAARAPESVPRALVGGTISGWEAVPLAEGHELSASVLSSQPPQLVATSAGIPQGTRTVSGNDGEIVVPQNLCFAKAGLADCHWTLATRPGKQAFVAPIVDVDTRGTDGGDAARALLGLAIARGRAPSAGDVSMGELLTPASSSPSPMMALLAQVAAPPPELPLVDVTPLLDLGDEGLVPLASAAPREGEVTVSVPRLEGVLARDASWALAAEARSRADRDVPSSTVWWRGDAATSPRLGDWWSPPAALSVVAGQYAFVPPAGARFTSAMIADAAGPAWSVMIFDGSRSFSLPALAPSPLSGGALTFTVTAWDVPGFDPAADVALDDLAHRLTHRSRDAVSFTR